MILFRPAAARELAADVRYYDEQYADRGQRFAEAVDRTLGLVSEWPLAFPILYEPDIRSAKVAKFPYRIVYVIDDAAKAIDVTRIAHRREVYE